MLRDKEGMRKRQQQDNYLEMGPGEAPYSDLTSLPLVPFDPMWVEITT